MMNILVTGGHGQLALCIKDLSENLSEYNFIFLDFEDLDITNKEEVEAFFNNNNISYCINCAAFTNVDKSETEKETSKKVNEDGALLLAKTCAFNSIKLIQISTDFVFDGKQSFPYKEADPSNPLGIYGQTKLNGELAVIKSVKTYFIIRTSWLYSEYGNNFLKTMLRLGKERDELSVVYDQVGSPTYAKDLAEVIIKIITNNNENYGVYHYSNEGIASWYDFAKAIFDESNTKVNLLPIKSEAYPTPAKRPNYSVLDKEKIKSTLNISIPYWRDSLKKCLENLN
jgi:dTDP-4-dehydrorhamnose reductase